MYILNMCYNGKDKKVKSNKWQKSGNIDIKKGRACSWHKTSKKNKMADKV